MSRWCGMRLQMRLQMGRQMGFWKFNGMIEIRRKRATTTAHLQL